MCTGYKRRVVEKPVASTNATIRDATWDEIEELRTRISSDLATKTSLVEASQAFVGEMCASFPTVALARVFVVAPFRSMSPVEQQIATETARSMDRSLPIAPTTPVLALLGSAGVVSAWNSRETSLGHRAIPLFDASFVQSAPMIASLLKSLDVDLGNFTGDSAVQLRRMGVLNARFYVPDARTAKDDSGRNIIAAQDFVSQHRIRTVFGMGGHFVGRVLTVVILFTREELEAAHIDRLVSFISTFKMSTSALVDTGAMFAPAA